ncbi:MAG: hypothetical protein KatS3mg118_1286 [Paracoccaceae bacterium]|nr:MAG: hypothetical protein KatS3mg118_1286 [Paracoccaceae bacterium]
MMKLIKYGLLALAMAASVGAPALAGSEDAVVEDAWARASIGTGRPGAAYMTARNTGDVPIVGIAARGPVG